jgi:hypothetical protein
MVGEVGANALAPPSPDDRHDHPVSSLNGREGAGLRLIS